MVARAFVTRRYTLGRYESHPCAPGRHTEPASLSSSEMTRSSFEISFSFLQVSRIVGRTMGIEPISPASQAGALSSGAISTANRCHSRHASPKLAAAHNSIVRPGPSGLGGASSWLSLVPDRLAPRYASEDEALPDRLPRSARRVRTRWQPQTLHGFMSMRIFFEPSGS